MATSMIGQFVHEPLEDQRSGFVVPRTQTTQKLLK
jgi:hypothetical protein